MINVPDPMDVSPELRAETERLEEISARKTAAETKTKQLDHRLRTGPTTDERQKEVARVLANESPRNFKDEFETALQDYRALEDAEQQQRQLVSKSRHEACRKVRDTVRPHHDRLMKKLATSAVELHGVWVELFAIKTALRAKDAGLGSLFDADPQNFLGSPLDRATDFAAFLRDCGRLGFLARLPKEFDNAQS